MVIIPAWANVALDVKRENNLSEERFRKLVWYLGLCEIAGFADSDDKIRACAGRWIIGKRKVSPPGTKKKKREAQRARKILRDPPDELRSVMEQALKLPMVKQYVEGNDKVFNAIFGFIMKNVKTEPLVVKELLTVKLTELRSANG